MSVLPFIRDIARVMLCALSAVDDEKDVEKRERNRVHAASRSAVTDGRSASGESMTRFEPRRRAKYMSEYTRISLSE